MKTVEAVIEPTGEVRLIQPVYVTSPRRALVTILEEAPERKAKNQTRKAKSNRRLKSLCSALQRERNPAKVREIKDRLSQEFYHGDQPK